MESPSAAAVDARAALDEAGRRAASVRRADGRLRWILLAIAAAYVLGSTVVSLFPRGVSVIADVTLAAIVVVFVAAVIVVGMRIRAFSRTAIVWYFVAIVVFNVWNWLVIALSIGTGWWARTQPSSHLAVSELVGVLPLIVVAYFIGRR